MLKQLHINISFLDVLEQMSSYVKFLKDILTKKKRMNDFETVALTRVTSDIFKNGVRKKIRNPGSFMVPCFIGGIDLGHALYDLGAIIKLMSLSIFKKLEIEKVQPTHMRLRFHNRSMAKPLDKIKDLLIKVDKF
ncbi:uncharacterized protein LOC127150368 [Cucumis melo]|uniref:Uncharacterized protein LOC127150368 n=1 Tax=Cucumis melo TaxID=3656 RepID=A0ABM3L1X9_CUCME|nr:uncharacterized protein LOC127150368 [Cucumis melo]